MAANFGSRRPFKAVTVSVLCAAWLFASNAAAFYLPGVAPTDYKEGEKVELLVNALSSQNTVLPYDYYYEHLHFCPPENGPVAQAESLGSILFGDRLYSSPFVLNMKKDEQCKLLCTAKIPGADAKFINQAIREEYSINWVVDGLPAAKMSLDKTTEKKFYAIGFELGKLAKDNLPYLNNHYDINIYYHKEGDNYRVVGVIVWAFSMAKLDTSAGCIPPGEETSYEHVYLDEMKENTVQYSYNVKWERSQTPWGTRWDNYLHVFDPKIHWFSLINSAIIVLFLSGMVGVILLRALHKDIMRYNASEVQEDAQEDFGWKLVHGDVFRPPKNRMLLSVLLGNGAQLIMMVVVTLVFAVLGFLSPSSRGSLTTVMLVFYVFFGSVAGYYSARMYKMFGGEAWRQNVAMTAFLVPGLIFGTLLVLNFFLVGSESSGAVPFGTLFALIGMWFLVSVPLCFIGAYFGFKKPRVDHPVRTNQIPRQIPEQPFYLRPIPSILMGGILPFGVIFIELYFIMNSIWAHRIYYVFGFLFLVFTILAVTCAEVTILMCYFHLCSEDYHWWWRAFLTSGASALYMALYGVLYFFTKLSIDNVPSAFLYFGWTFAMSLMFFVLTGTIGFAACYFFIRKIYASIKID
ncbi:hypothetical protein BJ742DRAFT_846841 [Cladochytrium replicatum]|nr:hypothetical protein BJ742DRAFT_846841 [Cladochytrium replicatum]